MTEERQPEPEDLEKILRIDGNPSKSRFETPKFRDFRAEGAFSTLPLTSIGGFWNFLPAARRGAAREILWVFENFHTNEPSLIFKLAGFVAMGVNNK